MARKKHSLQKLRGGGTIYNKNIDISQPNKCLICGEETNGYHFCKKCFFKYSKKELIIKINNCLNTEVLGNQYICKEYVSDDGHILKSQGEVRIDEFLSNEGIFHKYETDYYPKKNKTPIKPDWLLPNYKGIGDVYIEYWGVENNKEYDQQKEYKMNIYKEEKLTVICVNPTDMGNLRKNLKHKLENLKKGEINE